MMVVYIIYCVISIDDDDEDHNSNDACRCSSCWLLSFLSKNTLCLLCSVKYSPDLCGF